MTTAIEDVKARLDIVDVVSSYVPNLKRSGRTWKANCPFHQERTPSFIVDPSRESWHCFGACSTGGDVIEFVRRIEGLDFKQALQRCAERAGVELRPPTRREQQQREEHERLLAANEAAAVFFQAALEGPAGAEALVYAERRGLDRAARETWQLGYARDSWSALTDHLRGRGFSDAELVAAGLAIEGERGLYDRFRGRLIFPTRDVRGRLIGFGGRALGVDQEPKYLNTPQTPLFDKSGTLYGLDRAGQEARRAERLIVVEGYMDVIACHQAGLTNVAASMGTAITERQMRLIKRFTPNVVLALDADNAGSEATLRAVHVAAGAADTAPLATIDWRGLVSYQDALEADIRIAALPDGEDPDSLVRADPQRMHELITNAKPVADHLFEAIAERSDLDDPRARSRAVEALAPTVSAIADPVVRAHYVQRLARLGRVDERTVLAMLARSARSSRPARPAPVPTPAEVKRAAKLPRGGTPADPIVDDGEGQLLRLLLLRPDVREDGLALDPAIFEDGLNRRLFEALCEQPDLDERADELDEDLFTRRQLLRAAALPEALRELAAPELARALTEIAEGLRTRRRQRRLREAAEELAEEVAGARREGSPVLDFARGAVAEGALPSDVTNEIAELAAAYHELNGQQRELAVAELARRADRQRAPARTADGGGPAPPAAIQAAAVPAAPEPTREPHADPAEWAAMKLEDTDDADL